MRLNMGCGHNRVPGFVNVDAAAECEPDQVVDLERTPWPWADDSVQEVRFIHSLEHMGADPKVFLAMMRELYRVCVQGARVVIHVPHPRHDNFINDPTHVRAITPQVLSLFDREMNDQWKASGASNSPLAHYTGVDFKLLESRGALAPRYYEALQAGQLSREDIDRLAREANNVVEEYRMTLEVRKAPA